MEGFELDVLCDMCCKEYEGDVVGVAPLPTSPTTPNTAIPIYRCTHTCASKHIAHPHKRWYVSIKQTLGRAGEQHLPL